MRPTPTLSATAAGMALAIAAFASPALAQSDDGDQAPDQGDLTAVRWQVVSVGPAPPLTEQIVQFEPDGGLKIMTGCATYTSTYSVEEASLDVDQARRDFGSLADCSFGEQGSADLFLDTLENAEAWEVDEEGLVIESPRRNLTFEPAAPASGGDGEVDPGTLDPEAVTGSWQLESIVVAMADEPMVPPEDVTVTLMLTADGTLRGDGGCGEYEADYTIVGDAAITIADLSVVEAEGCTSERAALQEFYLSMLPVVDEVSVTEGELVLSAALLTADLTYQPLES